jgi:hypothetical protein
VGGQTCRSIAEHCVPMIGTRESQYAKSVIGLLRAQELAIRVADTSGPDLQSRSRRDTIRMLKEHCQSLSAECCIFPWLPKTGVSSHMMANSFFLE